MELDLVLVIQGQLLGVGGLELLVLQLHVLELELELVHLPGIDRLIARLALK